MTLMTGISMFGKMSVGIVTIDRSPSTAISSATTTNVYGRRRASRTVHMAVPEATIAPRPVVEDHRENSGSCGTAVHVYSGMRTRSTARERRLHLDRGGHRACSPGLGNASN